MIIKENMNDLMIAVTVQAIKDYKWAIDAKRNFPIRKSYSKREAKMIKHIRYTIIECEEFFRGEIFGGAFPGIDPEMIIKRVRDYNFRIKKNDG